MYHLETSDLTGLWGGQKLVNTVTKLPGFNPKLNLLFGHNLFLYSGQDQFECW